MNFLKRIIFFVFGMMSLMSCSQQKINGASIVSPPSSVEESCYASLKKINADWVAVIPFAFTPPKSANVNFNSSRQWWGERTDGSIKLIAYAKKENLKVMLKPHVWHHRTWIGDFELQKEEDWQQWEQEYTDYVLHYAKIADQNQVDLFCVGTELKKVVLNRPQFFFKLIAKVKKVYHGQLTYASNWDNVNQIPFWKELNYIGVDAYFPLSEKRQPTVLELNNAWLPIKKELKEASDKNNRPILFTEYGFESGDYNTKETWGSSGKYNVNEQAQTNAYQSYFDSFYNENWFAGGFFWKWHLTPKTMRNKSKAFTPQGKKVIRLLKKKFSE